MSDEENTISTENENSSASESEGSNENASPQNINIEKVEDSNEGKSALGLFAKKLGVANTENTPSDKPLKIIAPPYVPNLKFKVLDQEKEMDEWIKPFVKNKDTEEKFRDILTKAHGLAKIKAERDDLRLQGDNYRNQVTKDYVPIVQQHNYLSQMANEGRQSGDWGKFFQAAQIPHQQVIRWAANVVSQLEKNPNYLNDERSSFQSHQQTQNLQSQNENLRQQMEQIQMQRTELEMDYTLRAPENESFSQIFDQRVGRPGAFREEVIRRGAMIEMTEKRVASTKEIVADLLKYYGGVPKAPSTLAQEEPSDFPSENQSNEPEGKPVLPNIKGRSTSPAKTVIRSSDDLRRLRRSRSGN